jgi:hypothetical protein
MIAGSFPARRTGEAIVWWINGAGAHDPRNRMSRRDAPVGKSHGTRAPLQERAGTGDGHLCVDA